VTPDGRHAVFHGADWTQVRDLRSGRWIKGLRDEEEAFALLAKRHGGLRVWDLARGQALATLKIPREKISPGYHPAMEGMTREEIDLHTPTALITAVVAAGRDKLIVSTEAHRTILFDLNRFEPVKELRYRVKVVHPDGRTAFSSGSSPGLVAFDLFDDRTGTVHLEDAVGHYGRGKIAFLGDGRMVTTNENSIRLWREGSWDCILTIPDAHEPSRPEEPERGAIDELVVLADGARIATSAAFDGPRVWNLEGGEATAMAADPDSGDSQGASGLTLHASGLVGATPCGVRLWDTRTGKVLWSRDSACKALDVARDGKIACAEGDRLVVVTP
jgi:WD40 repeat protein